MPVDWQVAALLVAGLIFLATKYVQVGGRWIVIFWVMVILATSFNLWATSYGLEQFVAKSHNTIDTGTFLN
jgi:hypothetical protein